MRLCWTIVLLSACAPKTLRFPGPLGPVGRDAPVRAPAELPADPAAPEDPSFEAPVLASRGDARLGRDVVSAASHYLRGDLDGWRDDCSGYACAVYNRAGIGVNGSVKTLFDFARERGWIHRRKVPRAGDLAFFDDTYDHDRDGRTDDPLTHVAVVMEVHRDGTVVLGHGGTGRGRTTLTMNLLHPDVHEADDGTLWNDWLRRKRASDPAGTKYLAGELWVAFATPDPRDLERLRVSAAR